jgi:hypothetical protein
VPEVAFVMSPGQDASLRELAETVAYELGLQGVPSSLCLEGFPEPRPGLVYILVGLRQFVELEGERALADTTILSRTVMLGAEPPEVAAHGERYLELLRRFGVVFDLNVRSVLALHRAGIPARTLRPGYSALRDRYDANAERPIDIAVIGETSPRRQSLLAGFAPVLSRYNCLIQLGDPSFPNTMSGPSFLGPERHERLARAKLVLNIHSGSGTAFDWSGALDGIHCGAVVVSEHATGIAPFDVGQHVVVAAPEALPYVASELLRDEARQQAIREAAYERLSNWIPYGLSIGVLRAALVELVGKPVRSGAPLGRPPKAKAQPRDRWNPQSEPPVDTRALPPAQAALVELLVAQRRSEHAEDVRTRSALGSELAVLRRQLTELQAKALNGEPSARVVTHSPARAGRRPPRTSVIVPAGTDPVRLETTLGSVLSGQDLDLELIVVGVDGAALRFAQDFCARHPRTSMRVIRLAVQQGTGAERNIAAEHAQSTRLLMVVSGDVLFPQALARLGPALPDGADVALTYGIAVTRDRLGSTDLASFYGWETARLRLGNFIRSPYLIRADALRSLGGYSDDPALSGWEDYDLFCRLAESPWRAERVPQMIATVESRIELEPESVQADPVRGLALRRRAPGLLAGLSAG